MKPRNSKEEIIKVPSDILLDVLTVIVKERLRHEISQVYGNRGIGQSQCGFQPFILLVCEFYVRKHHYLVIQTHFQFMIRAIL